MNRKFLIFLMCISFSLGITDYLSAQITVGNGTEPVKAALLDVKTVDNIEGGVTATRDATQPGGGGLVLPRVELVKKNELLPFIDKTKITEAEYSQDKKSHKGLMVYNITEVKDEDLFVGINMWDGEKWNGLSEKMAAAQGHVKSCESIKFVGYYENKTPLNGSINAMRITMEITKPGSYTIAAQAEPDNGYFFILSGVFMSAGTYDLLVPGAGTPISYTLTGGAGDVIKITFNDTEIPCSPKLKINNSAIKPLYTVNCSKTQVKGVYILDKALNPTTPAKQVIQLELNVSPAAAGAEWIIKTDEVEGISFEGSGYLSSATTQTVTLVGKGKPTSADTKKMTISSNSALSSATCAAYVHIAYPKKKILGLGSNSAFGYNIALPTFDMNSIYSHGGRKVLESKTNFGLLENSVVKCEGLEFINGGDSNTNSEALRTLILTTKPDIVVAAFNWQPSDACVDVLIEYMEKKGIVLFFTESASSVKRIFSRVLNLDPSTVSTPWGGGAGSIYTMNYVVGDEILNGPFGDVREKNWGEDASTTATVTGIPYGAVEVYSTSVRRSPADRADGNSSEITICRFKHVNGLWCGDGGFYSRGITSGGVGSNTVCPLDYTSDFKPIPKAYGYLGRYQVWNGIFYANAMTWAIKTAQFDGYNTVR